jgi:signal transduction histidine kinase
MTNSRHRYLRRSSTGSSRGVPVRAVAAAGAPARPVVAATDDAFFRYIVSGMRNGVLAITRQGTLALINEEAYRIFGVTAHPSDLGRPVAEVLKAQPEVVRVLTAVFDLHMLPNRVELRLRPTGKVIGYTLTLVRDDRGAVVGAAMFFKDLTRVEQLEERERLRDRLIAVGELAATIAHEVKNPLAAIEVQAGLLRRKVSDSPDAQAALGDIINEAKMANAIVQEVLEFVRPMRLHMEHTGIARALQAAVQLADTQARRGAVDVYVQVPPGLPLIQGDQHQLAQVFTNLLANAYEAMGGRGHVTITAQVVRLDDGADGREAVQVEVADDGPGMPQDVADRIFDPFFTTKAQGSGLGLAIVRKIVDAHDGQIDLKTTPGQGTTIRVILPTRAIDEE